jgi:hypothetical protein
LLDGEIVIARDGGTPDFHALRSRPSGLTEDAYPAEDVIGSKPREPEGLGATPRLLAFAQGCPSLRVSPNRLTEENMRTLRMALISGFAGALMASNVATLHAAPFADQRGKHEING